jgi:hypothetical protein
MIKTNRILSSSTIVVAGLIAMMMIMSSSNSNSNSNSNSSNEFFKLSEMA